MFGQFYTARDEALATGQVERDEYARELLTELLDRAAVLEDSSTGAYAAAVSGAADADERLQWLARAVDLFCHDANEARRRGLRARLYGETEFGLVDRDATGDGGRTTAERIGGYLVTADLEPVRPTVEPITDSTAHPARAETPLLRVYLQGEIIARQQKSDRMEGQKRFAAAQKIVEAERVILHRLWDLFVLPAIRPNLAAPLPGGAKDRAATGKRRGKTKAAGRKAA